MINYIKNIGQSPCNIDTVTVLKLLILHILLLLKSRQMGECAVIGMNNYLVASRVRELQPIFLSQ